MGNKKVVAITSRAEKIDRRTLFQLTYSAWAAGLLLEACAAGGDVETMSVEARISALLAKLTLEEKVALMTAPKATGEVLANVAVHYNAEPIVAGELLAHGIDGVRFSDGPRGIVMRHSTCFPVAAARGATWDPLLEGRVADAMGVEARIGGANLVASVCINVLRHPAWGRAQESYGEDPAHLAAMGTAAVRGLQRHVMACAKHFACNSMEDMRFKIDVKIGERALREVYLPHFKACVDAGMAAIMSAYNRVNGEYCGQNHTLLQKILKDDWGFDGFVMSDFVFGIYDGPLAANAGQDLEMPFEQVFGAKLVHAVRAGKVKESRIDDAARRLLRKQFRFHNVGEPTRYVKSAVAGKEHTALAREVAAAGMVLLKNEVPAGATEPLLPLEKNQLKKIALIGRLIETPNIGDEGSSRVHPPHIVTALQGLCAALPETEFVSLSEFSSAYDGVGNIDYNRLAGLDAVIAMVGYTQADEGEFLVVSGGDRDALTLRAEDEAMLLAASAVNKRTVAVMIGGSAIVTEAWRDQVPAVLMAFYPGMEGGHALADVLLGDSYPGGRLPFVVPKSAADLPFFDAKAQSVTYDLFHGYRYLDLHGVAPAFPFGFGLGYTTCVIGKAALVAGTVKSDGVIQCVVTVRNTGKRAGCEVVQAYVEYPEAGVPRPVRELKAFQKVALDAGESKELTLDIQVSSLAYWDEKSNQWRITAGKYRLGIGASSAASALQYVSITIKG